MITVLDEPWFYWAVGVAAGLPFGLVVLTEAHQALSRRGSPLARPIGLIRSYLLPLGALLALLVEANQVSPETTTVRIVATLFGFAILVVLLSGFNVTIFQGAPEGSWRRRMPSIFLEVARFVLIAVGVAMIFSRVWGANVGGIFTALGIGSIVLGLTLQNSIGQIISGLFVLFEQPFQLGDWIETPAARGRVVEVNWRATHINTFGKLLVMPNSELATMSFTNLSRPSGGHWIFVDTVFAFRDPPDQVCRLLTQAAGMLPQCRTDEPPDTVPSGGATYTTLIPLTSPNDAFRTKVTFLRWIWYASRRAGLHLDFATDDFATPERVDESLRIVAPILRLNDADREQLRAHIRITRYGAGEAIQLPGEVPERMTFLLSGRVGWTIADADGSIIPVRTLEEGEFLGQGALTREPVRSAAHALEETTVLQIEREYLADLVHRKPLLLHDIAYTIEEQRAGLERALASAAR
jgi:small-conductance mechanosensitive channel